MVGSGLFRIPVVMLNAVKLRDYPHRISHHKLGKEMEDKNYVFFLCKTSMFDAL